MNTKLSFGPQSIVISRYQNPMRKMPEMQQRTNKNPWDLMQKINDITLLMR